MWQYLQSWKCKRTRENLLICTMNQVLSNLNKLKMTRKKVRNSVLALFFSPSPYPYSWSCSSDLLSKWSEIDQAVILCSSSFPNKIGLLILKDRQTLTAILRMRTSEEQPTNRKGSIKILWMRKSTYDANVSIYYIFVLLRGNRLCQFWFH